MIVRLDSSGMQWISYLSS